MVISSEFNKFGRTPEVKGKNVKPRYNSQVARALEEAVLGRNNLL